jgi:two-component system phosphate regulon response regulator PhoB
MKETVLIIEDELALGESIKFIIEASGFETLFAPAGFAAFELLKKHAAEIDLIICDINLPDISGYNILTMVKNEPGLYKIPFIFLSAYADEKDVLKSLNMGADGYVTKPFFAKELIKVIRHAILKKKDTA